MHSHLDIKEPFGVCLYYLLLFISVKPGMRYREIGEVVNRHATMSGLSVVCGYLNQYNDVCLLLERSEQVAHVFLLSCKIQVKSYCGHGIGELFHCAPNIPHYSSILE